MNTSFLNLHSSIRLTVERNINLRAHLVLLAYRCVPVKELDVGVLSRHWTGRASEGTERKSIFQRRENKWPAIQVHLRLRLGREEKERVTGRSCKFKKHASRKRFRATFSFFTRSSGLPLDVWHFDCRGSPSERSEMPITGIALRGVSGQRTFVTAAVRHYRNCRRAICLKFGCRVFRDPH